MQEKPEFGSIPTWDCDVLVVGSGIAGLLTALRLDQKYKVLVLTKDTLSEGSTRYAQGGVAFAIGEQDSVELHVKDTLVAGVDFCDEVSVRTMVSEGRSGLEELQAFGTRFDRSGGSISMHREGGHSLARVAHHGDATGAEISRALCEQVLSRENISTIEGGFLTDLLVENGCCVGARCIFRGDETQIRATVVVLACGGVGQLFSVTTNPAVATGDGIAAAYRAGVRLGDIEFIQFHPTALFEEKNPRFLISEAVRGEGAHILNQDGERIMPGKHPLAELAPRDVVVRAMALHMIESGEDHLFLDVRHLDQTSLHQKFPMITGELEKRGYDVATDLIPISFAAHYTIGGIITDLDGRSSMKNLYACGETACTGVHGANRLASNSLLEGLVFSKRIATDINNQYKPSSVVLPESMKALIAPPDKETVELRQEITATALRYGGVFRSAIRLQRLMVHLLDYEKDLDRLEPSTHTRELDNLMTIAHLLHRAALVRTESRGTHQRQEFAQTDDFWHDHHILFESETMLIRQDPIEDMEW